jgi:hypothetical protein
MFISSSGNIGIRTNSPAYLLDVSGSVRFTGRAHFGTNSSFWLDPGLIASDPVWAGPLRIDGGVWLGASGQRVRVGSYVTPTARFEVVGLGSTSATTAMRVDNSGGQTSLVVLDNGFVGIGTGSAQYLLDVNGNSIIRSGSFTIGSTGLILPTIRPAGTGTVVFGGTSPLSPSVRIQGSNINFDIGNTQIGLFTSTTGNLLLQNGGTFVDNGYRLDVSGSTRITNGLNVTGSVDIAGTLTATVKSFIIEHPTKPQMRLQYGVLEGPEHSVYIRGKLTNQTRIELPDYWYALVHEDSITVNLTPIGSAQNLWVNNITSKYIDIASDSDNISCFYTVFAERKDIDKLITEYEN